MPAEFSILDVNVLRPLDALFEAVRRRTAGERFLARIDFRQPRTAFAVKQALRILEATDDREERVAAFDALAREQLNNDGVAQRDASALDRRVVQTVREIVLLSEGIAVGSWHDQARLELAFGFTAEPYFVETAPDREVPAFTRSENPDAIVVWAPRDPATDLALIAFALEELHAPLLIVCAEGEKKPRLRAEFVGYAAAAEALARARFVIDPARHPANALELAKRGLPLIVSLSTGAYEALDGAGVFVPWDRADVLRAAQSAPQAAPVLRPSRPLAAAPAPRDDRVLDGPLVSIVVRTYNRPAFLARALESIERQTYRNVEAVVVNDGGEDVGPLVRRFERARSIAHERRQGAVPALNTGLRESRGELVGLLDDDDVFFPDHVAGLVAAYLRAGCDAVHGDTISAFYDVSVDERVPYGFAIFLNKLGEPTDLYLGDGIGPMAALFRRDVALELGGYDETLPHCEDWDFWIRLSQRCDFVHVPRVTAMYSIRNDGTNMMSYNTAGFEKAMAMLIEKYPLRDRPMLDEARRESFARFLARGAQAIFPQPALERR